MELPPSGWYPDPYGVAGLLRWWDGSTWTQHTHAASGTDSSDGAGQAAAAQQTTVQPAIGQPATVQPTTVQPTAVQPAVQPTTVQPAVQATTVQPAVQATSVQPTVYQPAVMPRQGQDANGTQVLFLGEDAWTTPGGPGQGDRYGYYRARRRRRLWMTGGLAGGTALALGLIALVVTSLGNSPATPAAAHTPTTPVAATTPPPQPSPTPSATQSAAVLTDATSGLSYTEFPSPWQPTCPASLNSSFDWTAGESAIVGQVNGGQTTWYGEACSGPLPQQYGYNGVADLENTATNLANNFNGAYYGALSHNYQVQVSQPVTISGHAGWEVKFLMTYTNAQGQGLQFTQEQGVVVVADLGSVPPAVFFASIPGNLAGNVDSLVSSLQVAVPPAPGGGGSPGDGSPGDGSPAGGSPGPGDGGDNGGGGN